MACIGLARIAVDYVFNLRFGSRHLGFTVWGLGFRFWDLGFRVHAESGMQGLGFRV